MALPENEYIVLSDATIHKRDGKRPFEILRRWLVQCPQCSEVRLVVGARENDQYVCKDCGHSFTITNDDLAEQSREAQ
jgi:DNA-directed RNA polymerase subunit RPC12/RpoP